MTSVNLIPFKLPDYYAKKRIYSRVLDYVVDGRWHSAREIARHLPLWGKPLHDIYDVSNCLKVLRNLGLLEYDHPRGLWRLKD